MLRFPARVRSLHLAVPLLAIAAGLPLTARADIFIFHDLQDVITVERIGTGPTQASLLGHFLPDGVSELQNLTLSRADGTRIISPSSVATGLDFGININGPGEPPPNPLGRPGSDALLWTGLIAPPCSIGDFTCEISFGFFSKADSVPPGFEFPSVQYNPIGEIVEDGSVQTALDVVWSDGTVDTIKFQSDVEAVPEPSAVILLLSVFILLGLNLAKPQIPAK